MKDAASAPIAPVVKAARIDSLDILRGVAVFGILMMNITAFGLIFPAYDNPLIEGGYTGPDRLAYAIINVGFEGTMRGIFSMLFGAGIVLLTERMEMAGRGAMAAEVHFRRMLWMMLFGFIHWALLLWTGEILFAYSMCGLVLFSFRKLAPRVQLALAAGLLVVAVVILALHYFNMAELNGKAMAAQQAKASGTMLDSADQAALAEWSEAQAHYWPNADMIAQFRGWHAGSYIEAVKGQWPFSVEFQWKGAPFWLLFDMIPFMLIGMALLKLNVLDASRPAQTYARMALGGYAIGLPLGFYELGIIIGNNFSTLSFAHAGLTYQFSRLAMVAGHLGLLLLIIRVGLFKRLQRALAAVGQMALTNYLMQTIICTALFYGFGLGLYGKLLRHEHYYVVFAIWLIQLVWSPLWLRRFQFGPFEWLWRSLTYWKRQPMRI